MGLQLAFNLRAFFAGYSSNSAWIGRGLLEMLLFAVESYSKETLGMYSNLVCSLIVRYLPLGLSRRNLSPVSVVFNRTPVFAAWACACLISALPVSAQTVIYDGSQQLNFYSGTDLTGPLMLNNTPGDDTRNGIVQSGADPNVLEQGDAAWFRSTGRRMRNTNLGLAGSATGVDGDFMSSLFDSSGETTQGGDANGVGASYVLYDNGVTTGPQILNFSLFYNDATPNLEDGTNSGDGGVVAVRVQGVQGTGDTFDPWGTDAFRHLASSGGSAAGISAGQHRDNSGEEAGPQVDNLLIENSNNGGALTPSADWQDISLSFDLGAGYEYIIFSFAGVAQDADVLGADRFGFDDISYEVAPFAPEDIDQDGDIDGADFLQIQRDNPSLIGDWQAAYSSPLAGFNAVPEPTSLMLLSLAISAVTACRQRRK